jgi:hypothetical protein
MAIARRSPRPGHRLKASRGDRRSSSMTRGGAASLRTTDRPSAVWPVTMRRTIGSDAAVIRPPKAATADRQLGSASCNYTRALYLGTPSNPDNCPENRQGRWGANNSWAVPEYQTEPLDRRYRTHPDVRVTVCSRQVGAAFRLRWGSDAAGLIGHQAGGRSRAAPRARCDRSRPVARSGAAPPARAPHVPRRRPRPADHSRQILGAWVSFTRTGSAPRRTARHAGPPTFPATLGRDQRDGTTGARAHLYRAGRPGPTWGLRRARPGVSERALEGRDTFAARREREKRAKGIP